MVDVRAAFDLAEVQVDDELVDYIAAMLEDMDVEDLGEQVGGLLEAHDIDETQCDKVCALLTQQVTASSPSSSEGAQKQLAAPISILDDLEWEAEGPAEKQKTTQKEPMQHVQQQEANTGKPARKSSKNKRGKSKRNSRRSKKDRRGLGKKGESQDKGGDEEQQNDGIMIEGAHWTKRGRAPPGAPRDVQMTGLDLHIKGHQLLEGSPLILMQGCCYGLVGRNGVGKTTLLRCIARKQIVHFPQFLSTLHVEQEAAGTAQTPLEYMLECARKCRGGSCEEEDEEDGVYAADVEAESHRAAKILAGLQFTPAMQEVPMSSYSGGWRMRVALATALLIEPDLLLLDEPTNHLDLPAQLWLSNFLQEYANTVVVVSHDRAFLNEVCTDIVVFRNKKLTYYPGNYDAYTKTRDEMQTRMMRAQEALDKRRDHARESMEKMRRAAAGKKKGRGRRKGGDDKKLNQVAERRKKIDKMGLDKTMDGTKWNTQTHGGMRLGSINAQGLSSRKHGNKRTAASVVDGPDRDIRFTLPEVPALGVLPGASILQLSHATFGYPDKASGKVGKMVIKDVSLDISLRSRVGILGSNGAGKSTLLKLLIGELEPQRGKAFRLNTLRVGHFNQFHVDQLDLSKSALEFMCERFPLEKEQHLRGQLGGMGIHGATALQKMKTLSGGQKSRVSFALMTMAKPHILVLDEPTNHLDMDTIDALAAALKSYGGGVVVVSHDAALIEGVCTELWEIRSGDLQRFEGSYIDYRKRVARRLKL